MAFPTGQASDRELLATPSTSSRGRQTPIRVLVADDEPKVREALADLINEEPTLQLVGDAEGGRAQGRSGDQDPPSRDPIARLLRLRRWSQCAGDAGRGSRRLRVER